MGRTSVDPSSMFATDLEIAWAKDIKRAVESRKGIDNLTDLEYLHHAIVAKNKTRKALLRIKQIQKYRETIGIRGEGTFRQGWGHLMDFFKQQPGLISTVGIDHYGRHVVVIEYRNFNPKAIVTKEDWRVVLMGLYYLFQASQPTVAAIRNGVVFIVDSENVTSKNISRKIERKAAEFYTNTYPVRIKQVAVLDSPGAISTIYEMIKFFLSRRVKKVVEMSCKERYLEENKEVFPVHILPASMGGLGNEDQMKYRIQEFLVQRLENAESFQL